MSEFIMDGPPLPEITQESFIGSVLPSVGIDAPVRKLVQRVLMAAGVDATATTDCIEAVCELPIKKLSSTLSDVGPSVMLQLSNMVTIAKKRVAELKAAGSDGTLTTASESALATAETLFGAPHVDKTLARAFAGPIARTWHTGAHLRTEPDLLKLAAKPAQRDNAQVFLKTVVPVFITALGFIKTAAEEKSYLAWIDIQGKKYMWTTLLQALLGALAVMLCRARTTLDASDAMKSLTDETTSQLPAPDLKDRDNGKGKGQGKQDGNKGAGKGKNGKGGGKGGKGKGQPGVQNNIDFMHVLTGSTPRAGAPTHPGATEAERLTSVPPHKTEAYQKWRLHYNADGSKK